MKAESRPKIVIITTSRSDWVSVAPIAKAIDQDPGFDLTLIAGGYHFIEELGYSFQDVRSQGLKRVMQIIPESLDYSNMFLFCNLLQKQVIRSMQDILPDFVLITGDRLEQLECAIAAKATGSILVHLCGGDLSGNLDNIFRYAISELADYHFVKTRESKKRLIKRGFDKSKIEIVGLPAFDFIKSTERRADPECLRENFNLTPYCYILVLFNPDTYDDDIAFSRMKGLLNELRPFPEKKLVMYPNGDKGSKGIINAIHDISQRDSNYIECKNISPERFILLEKYAALMIGNSSSALWEAPIFGTPVINIGTRQDGREALFGVVTLREFKGIHASVQDLLGTSPKERSDIAQQSRKYAKFGESSKLTRKYLRAIWENVAK